MTDHIQTLTNIHQRLTEIAQLMASGEATGDQLQLISKQIEWSVLADEFEPVVGRYRFGIRRYAKKLIRNLRRPYLVYHDCVQAAHWRDMIVWAIKDSPSLRLVADQQIFDAWERDVRRDQLKGRESRMIPQPLSLAELYLAAKQKIDLGRELERHHVGFMNCQRVFYSELARFAKSLAAESSGKIRPPPNYASWLDYAVDCMDTRSLEQEDLWISNPAQRYWPEGTTGEQMEQAAQYELAELRDHANSNQLEAPCQILENCVTVPQAEIDAWTAKVAGDAPPLEGLRDDASRDFTPFNNRTAIGKAGSGGCYHCLSFFSSEQIVSWTDDGQTAICPCCGIDSVVAQTDPPITMEQLQVLHQEAFGSEKDEK